VQPWALASATELPQDFFGATEIMGFAMLRRINVAVESRSMIISIVASA
jgi:hypothetical protein